MICPHCNQQHPAGTEICPVSGQRLTVTFTPTPVNQPLALQVNPLDGAEIVWVPAGEFLMGSNASVDPYFYGAEGPQHMVTLDEFWIYRTEVTNAMYEKCVAAGDCPRPAYVASAVRDDYYGNSEYADYPVVYVLGTCGILLHLGGWSPAYRSRVGEGRSRQRWAPLPLGR
jgi:formylglycine-generating enzyme required for sulfatase activity